MELQLDRQSQFLIQLSRQWKRFKINDLNNLPGDIHIGIIQSITFPGSEDIAFNPTETIFISPGAEPTAMNFGNEYSVVEVYQTCGTTVELEDPDHQHQQRHVCVLWNHVPEELTLKRSERTVSYKFIMTADESASLARQELTDGKRYNPSRSLGRV